MRIIQKLTLLIGFLLLSFGAISQPPPPPADPSVTGNTPVGGGAPVGSGTLILIGLGVVYAVKKVYKEHIDRKELEIE